jgi:DNA-binding CsgD family transcriptional regulator
MSLTLTSEDQRRLRNTSRLLLSPLDHADVDRWRSEVNRSVKVLLGADMASFLLPAPGRVALYSEDLSPDRARQYTSRTPRFFGSEMWRRKVRLVVSNEAMLFDDDLTEYRASEYYNDYVAPEHAFDPLSLSIGLEEEPRPDAIAGLLLHHGSLRTPPFGARGLELLRLLVPAFRAGVCAWREHADRRASFARLLDATMDAALLCDRSGRILHRTPALSRLLEGEPAGEEVVCAAALHARGLFALRDASGALEGGVGKAREVATSRARYRLEGCFVPAELCGGTEVVVLTLRCASNSLPARDILRARFGFTRRQADVALLLARGRSNEALARELCISPHTARHHTEQVLLKLGARSRAEVGALLRCAGSDSGRQEPPA